MNKLTSREYKLFFAFTLAHIPLGLVLYRTGALALAHPLAVFLLGLHWAFKTKVPLARVALVLAYLVGAEVLWRMAQVPIYWEFGKFGSAAIMAVALVRRREYGVPKLAFWYILALVPACFLTFAEFSPLEVRSQLSANMSGPLLLFMSCWFFSRIGVTGAQLRRLFFAMIGPLVSVGFAAFFYTVTAEDIQFSTESNFATSGGFGPNQVSSMLGLGVFVTVCCLLLFKANSRIKIFLGAVGVFLAAQSVMTFSRGGMYNAVGASAAMFLFQLQDVSKAIKSAVPILILSLIFLWVVFPRLDNFTGGKLQERFEETNTTNRAELVESDLAIFAENPVMGVGVGVSHDYRAKFFGTSGSNHTELTRLISEHGSFGLLALALLGLMCFQNFKRQTFPIGRALVVGAALWSVFYMLNAGMRLAAPSYMWGLTFVTLAAHLPHRRPRAL